MSDERPAGGHREAAEMAPPGEAPARAPASPVRQGVRAALILFAIAVAVELVALAGVRLSSDPDAHVVDVFMAIGILIFIAGLWAALTVSEHLPPAARRPFWATGVLCAFLSMILWGVTCGLAGTPRLN